jgi:hypothetical protein
MTIANNIKEINKKWLGESYPAYLKARGIDADDFAQECEVIQWEHPTWTEQQVRKQALKQSQRAISGNRRKRSDGYTLEDKRQSLPAVAERHRQLAVVWEILPESVHTMLAKAMEDETYKLSALAKRRIIAILEDECLPLAICTPDSLFGLIMQLINDKDGTYWALSDTLLPRKVKHTHYLTRQEVKQDLKMEPVNQFDEFDLTYGDYRF